MENQTEHKPDGEQTPDQAGREIPFDATTNFSLLGWLWDKFNKKRSSKKLIDLKLEQ
jgi:hypothetical protein